MAKKHSSETKGRAGNFGDSPRLNKLRHRAAEFTAQQIIPVAAYHDRTATFAWSVLHAARPAGLVNTTVPEQYGGPGLSSLEEAVIAEEFGYGCSGIWTSLGITNLATTPIAVAGTGRQKKEWFGRMIIDEQIPAFGLTEPGGGSDVAASRTEARRVGDHYVINGSKRYISNVDVADFIVLFVVTDPSAGGRGLSAIIVPKASEGFVTTQAFDKGAHRSYQTAEIEFNDVVVPAANLLGVEGQGFHIAAAALDRGRPLVAAAAVGVARRALAESIRYARERTAFGKPIIEHQGVGHQIARIATDVDAARLLCLRSAADGDAGHSNAMTAAMAKAFATDTAMSAATSAVQIFGAAGIMRHNPVEKLIRDAKVLQVYEGANEIQRNVIVRELQRNEPLDVTTGLSSTAPVPVARFPERSAPGAPVPIAARTASAVRAAQLEGRRVS